MANFITTRYLADSGDIHPMRIQEDRVIAADPVPSGPVSPFVATVKISKGNRAFGIRPRGVRLKRVSGTAPDQRTRYTFLPVRTPEAWAEPAFNPNATIVIGANSWTVVDRVNEDR